MSTGQLRLRIRAYERERTWAPDYVADRLAGIRQAADKHRTDASIWGAQAAATTEQDTADRLHDDAAKSAALSGPFGRHTGRAPTGATSSTPVQTSVMSRMTPSRTVMKVATSKCCSCPPLSPDVSPSGCPVPLTDAVLKHEALKSGVLRVEPYPGVSRSKDSPVCT